MLGVKLRGRYEILKALGTGGFSETFLARDLDFPGTPHCVVKQLKPQCDDDPWGMQTARRLFDSEAAVLSRLGSHPQIPQLMAYFEEDQQFYLVQEFIEGNQLSEELDAKNPWTEKKTTEFLQDTLGVLEFIHSNNVVHRDIKPENIIRRISDGKLVLIDFGAIKQVAARVVNAPETSNVTIAVGTPAYMPIEQQRGKPRYSSDLYALGLIAIQGVTGLSPRHLPEDSRTGELRWRDRAQISDPLAEILTKMVRWNFRERYQSASEVIDDLKYCQPLVGDRDPTSSSGRQPDPEILERVARPLDGHPDSLRIKKLLFCARTDYWENDAQKLATYSMEDLVRDLYIANPSLNQFSDAIYGVVKILNKQTKYFSVFNIIVHQVSQLYQDSDGKVPTVTPLPEPSQIKHRRDASTTTALGPGRESPHAASSAREASGSRRRSSPETERTTVTPPPKPVTAIGDSQAAPTPAPAPTRESTSARAAPALDYDPFDMRLDIIRYATPLRVKILLFSLLFYQVGSDPQDLSTVMSHDFDDLLARLIQEHPTLEQLEKRLYATAEVLEDKKENLQAATAVVKSLSPIYSQRSRPS